MKFVSGSFCRLCTRILFKAITEEAVRPEPKLQHRVAYHWRNDEEETFKNILNDIRPKARPPSLC